MRESQDCAWHPAAGAELRHQDQGKTGRVGVEQARLGATWAIGKPEAGRNTRLHSRFPGGSAPGSGYAHPPEIGTVSELA